MGKTSANEIGKEKKTNDKTDFFQPLVCTVTEKKLNHIACHYQ